MAPNLVNLGLTALTVLLTCGVIAATFGAWVLREVRLTSGAILTRMDRNENRVDAVHTKLDALNGAVAENTRARQLWQDAHPEQAAALATLMAQMEILNGRVIDELIPMMNSLAQIQGTMPVEPSPSSR